MMFDGIVYLIFGVFTLIAFLRGFIKELFSIAGQVGAIYITYHFNDQATKVLSKNIIQSQSIASIVSYILVYLMCLFLFWIANTLISMALISIRLGFIDRFFGILLGALKSYIICFTIYVSSIIIYPMLEEINSDDIKTNDKKEIIVPQWISSSKTYPFFKTTQEIIDRSIKDTWSDGLILTIKQKIEESQTKKEHSIEKKNIEESMTSPETKAKSSETKEIPDEIPLNIDPVQINTNDKLIENIIKDTDSLEDNKQKTN